VILAAFAVIVLVSGASAVWLFRAAGTSRGRSRSVVTPATGLAPSADDAPGEPEHEADGTAPGYPERTWLGAAMAGTGQPAGFSAGDGAAGPDDSAGTAGDVYDVYDVEDWPGGEDSRGGPGGAGPRSPGRRGWPDAAKSLYSRGWPVMNSSPRGPGPGQPGNAMDAGAAGEPDAGESCAGDSGAGDSDAGDSDAGDSDAGQAGAAEPGAAQADPAEPSGGARVYVLGESRRSGR